MKKNLFLVSICICYASVSLAQVKVDSNGRIGIGTSSPNTSYKTTIDYIPENAKAAKLCIYNLQGAQIKQIAIAERGEGIQAILGAELTAGMYLYALIVDGKEIDVKRMILTE